MDDLEIGDSACFFSTNGKSVGHTGIYIGGGEMDRRVFCERRSSAARLQDRFLGEQLCSCPKAMVTIKKYRP